MNSYARFFENLQQDLKLFIYLFIYLLVFGFYGISYRLYCYLQRTA